MPTKRKGNLSGRTAALSALLQQQQHEPINTCGFPPGQPQSTYYRAALGGNVPFDRVGLTRSQLFRKISDVLTPGYFEWHSWTQRVVDAMMENRWVGLTGCAGSAKTHNVVGVAVNWWLCWPRESSVIICSTTRNMLKKRGWAEVQRCYGLMPNPKYGNFIDSEMMWQETKGDAKHAIFGMAVEEGGTYKVADYIKGIHTKRQMVIVDEATGVRDAIYAAVSNLWSYPVNAGGEFVMVVIGNMMSWFGPMGQFCTPLNGKGSVTVDDDEWQTQPQLDNQPGICLHFDALKSPNILEGKVVSIHLPTKETVQAAAAKVGSESDPTFWANFRGFPAPEGALCTVFTPLMLINGHAQDKPPPFTGRDLIVVGGFDPAYSIGGDKAAIGFAKCGEVVGGGHVISLLPPMIVPLSATSKDKISYQLARGARAMCEQYACPSQNLAIDITSNPSVADIMEQEWGPVLRISSSESPTENRTVSYEDTRLCRDVYKTKGTELWFSAAQYVHAGQVRGLSNAASNDLIERCYQGGIGGMKYQLETKALFKGRMNRSPDDGDCFTLICEAARVRGVQIRKIGLTAEPDKKAVKLKQDYDDLHETADYSEPEELEEAVY